jgi:hypothetical protein
MGQLQARFSLLFAPIEVILRPSVTAACTTSRICPKDLTFAGVDQLDVCAVAQTTLQD